MLGVIVCALAAVVFELLAMASSARAEMGRHGELVRLKADFLSCLNIVYEPDENNVDEDIASQSLCRRLAIGTTGITEKHFVFGGELQTCVFFGGEHKRCWWVPEALLNLEGQR